MNILAYALNPVRCHSRRSDRFFSALLASLVCVTWASLPLKAQSQRFKSSFNAGLNLSQIDGDRLAGFNQPGLAAGLQVNTVLSPRWEWSLELLFSQQGARRNTHDDPAAAYDRIRLNRAEIPLMLQFNEWKFQVGAGLSYSRHISHKVVDAFGVDVSEQIVFRPNGLSAVIGATVFLRERSGLNLLWQKNFWDLHPASSSQPRWIGRSIGIRGVFLL